MRVYIEFSEGSMKPWRGSLGELIERMSTLENRGYTLEVRVL